MFATLEGSGLGNNLRVEVFRGVEALCRPFEMTVQFNVPGGASELDLAAAVGTAAKLRLSLHERTGKQEQLFAGVLARLRLLVQTDEWGLFEALIVPRVWHLGLTRHSRVFTKMSVPDIITEVLAQSGLGGSDFELRLTGSYAPEELVVQYHESSLDFIHRWMEHEGIYYYFEHSEEGSKMIIVDAPSAHDKMVEQVVPYRPTMSRDESAGECFDSFTVQHDTTVARVRLTDYDYAHPVLDVSGMSAVNPQGVGEHSEHGARFFDPGAAQRYADLRAEVMRARQVVQHASGSVLHMGAGYHYELSDHADSRYNITYLATEVLHFGNRLNKDREHRLSGQLKPEFDDPYRVQVTSIDARVVFRPALTTPKPRVWGMENGVVDGGAESPYAQIDAQGRYLAKFNFDESSLSGGQALTFVRMMQPHGGSTEGFHFPLRKGTEVVFSFLGGDPDRPVISGVVPNMTTQSPVTESNHTQNVIRTGANNHIILDDAAGAEFISIRTPKLNTGLYMGNPISTAIETFDGDGSRRWGSTDAAIYLITDTNTHFSFGGEWWVTSSLINERVWGTVTEHYHGHHHSHVVSGGHKHWVIGLVDEVYENSHELDVTGYQKITVSSTRDDTVKAKVTENYQEQETTIADLYKVIANGNEHHVVDDKFTVDASYMVEHNARDIRAIAENTIIEEAGTEISITAPIIRLNGTTSIILETPDRQDIDPNKKWWSAFSEKFHGLDYGFYGIKAAAIGVKIEVVGLRMTHSGMKMSEIAAWLRGHQFVLEHCTLKTNLGIISTEILAGLKTII